MGSGAFLLVPGLAQASPLGALVTRINEGDPLGALIALPGLEEDEALDEGLRPLKLGLAHPVSTALPDRLDVLMIMGLAIWAGLAANALASPSSSSSSAAGAGRFEMVWPTQPKLKETVPPLPRCISSTGVP